MRKLLFILLLAPALLVAQDTTKQTFRIGQYGITVAGKFHKDQSEIKLSDLYSKPTVEIYGHENTFKVTGFTVAIGMNGIFMDMHSNSDSLTPQMIAQICEIDPPGYIVINNVTYTGASEQPQQAGGLALKIVSLGDQAKIKQRIKVTSIGPIVKSGYLSLRALKGINKISIQNGLPNDKVISFHMQTPMDSVGESLESTNDSFTPRMKYLMQMCPEGSTILINDVEILSNGYDVIIPGVMLTIGSPE